MVVHQTKGSKNTGKEILAVHQRDDYFQFMDYNQAGDIRILVADDHPFMREAVSDHLKGLKGVEVCGQAANGIEAVELAKQLNPDAIIMDISMPEMNGIDATSLILQNQPNTQIFAMSIHDDESMRNKMDAAGATAYISKNSLFRELTETLRKHIRA